MSCVTVACMGIRNATLTLVCPWDGGGDRQRGKAERGANRVVFASRDVRDAVCGLLPRVHQPQPATGACGKQPSVWGACLAKLSPWSRDGGGRCCRRVEDGAEGPVTRLAPHLRRATRGAEQYIHISNIPNTKGFNLTHGQGFVRTSSSTEDTLSMMRGFVKVVIINGTLIGLKVNISNISL